MRVSPLDCRMLQGVIIAITTAIMGKSTYVITVKHRWQEQNKQFLHIAARPGRGVAPPLYGVHIKIPARLT